MDPVTVIVSATVTGAAAALKDTTSDIIKDTYNALKAAVGSRFRGNSTAEIALAESEKNPDMWEKPLVKGVTEDRLQEDDQILELVQKLLGLSEGEGPSGAKYNIRIGWAKGTVIGDRT